MESGIWYILLLGNNGPQPREPFNAMREVYLDVGPQQTTTYQPYTTFYETVTPTTQVPCPCFRLFRLRPLTCSQINTTSTSTLKSTLDPLTVTLPSKTLRPITSTPSKQIVRRA